MRIAIHQPNYLPYLGFFHKIYLSDIFAILDTAQFVKSGLLAWMNRNKIRTSQGWTWLTVPVLTKGKFPVSIKDARIGNTSDWRRKHLNSLCLNYRKAPYFHKYIQFFEALYKNEWEGLSQLNIEIIGYLLKELKISVKVVKVSDLKVRGKGSELLINICKELGADEYIYGQHGDDYMDFIQFEQNKIRLTPQDFKHPRYKQLYEPFLENMSAIDLLFNEGENSLAILQKAGGSK